MYQRRGGKVRADVGKLNAELVTGVAVGSGSNGGKRQTPAESAPPSSEAHRRPSMRRPSGLEGSYVAAESEAEQKERTKKQLESITGRMFQVLNDFEDDEDSYNQSSSRVHVERRRPSHSSRGHNRQTMRSNIDGMMANYDQIASEREELLESLADWFQQSHTDAGVRPSVNLSHTASAMTHRDRVSERGREEGTSPGELQLQRENMEGELAAGLAGQTPDSGDGGGSTKRDAVTMSWKYAAMEIYGLLSDVRDTDAAEMNALERHIMELLASLTQQSQTIDQLSTELQQQKELVHFSERTTQGLATENSDLRDQLKRVKGQLVEAQNRNKTPSKNKSQHTQDISVGDKGGGREGEGEGVNGDAGEGGKVDLYKAQIKDLNKRLTQLQEENESLMRNRAELPQKKVTEGEDRSSNPYNSEVATGAPPTPHPDNPAPAVSSLPPHASSSSQQVSQSEPRGNDTSDNAKELHALREQLQQVMDERDALEVECMKRRRGEEGGRKGKGKEKGLKRVEVQYRSQHTQTVAVESHLKASPHHLTPHHLTSPHITPHHLTSPHVTPHRVASHTTPSPTTHTTSTVTMTTGPVSDSNVAIVTTAASDSHMDALPTSAVVTDTVTMETNTVPSITVQTSTMGTVTMATTTETKPGTLDMVKDVINKVIVNQSDLIAADKATLHRIHDDLQQLCDVIQSCLVHSLGHEEGLEGDNDIIINNPETLVTDQVIPNHNRLVLDESHKTANKVQGGASGRVGGNSRGEVRGGRSPTREELKMFIGHAMQSIHDGESGSTAAAHQDTLQMVFETIQSRRQRDQEGTIAYPLPIHSLTRSGSHMTDLHHRPLGAGDTSEPHPNLRHSVNVRALGSSHDIHGNSHSKVMDAQRNAMLYPWGHSFRGHAHFSSHPHTSPTTLTSSHSPSLLLSAHNFPMMSAIDGGDAREGGGGGREGRKGRKKKRVPYSHVARSNFLQVGNTLPTPPRTAPPAGLKGVANYHGNHHHSNQTMHTLVDRSELPQCNDSGATFIDLLTQTPRVANSNRSDGNGRRSNRTGSVGGSTIKLPMI